jgi:hypothetical protein
VLRQLPHEELDLLDEHQNVFLAVVVLVLLGVAPHKLLGQPLHHLHELVEEYAFELPVLVLPK